MKIKKENLFCENCGAKLPVEKKSQHTTEPKAVPPKQNLNKKIRPSRKRFVVTLFSIIAVVIMISVIFTSMNFLKLPPSSPITKRVIPGPDGVEIEVPDGSASDSAEFSIVKIDAENVPTAPGWVQQESQAYNVSVTKPLQGHVVLKIPLPDGEVVMLGHYNHSGFWEIVPFTIVDGKVVAEVDSFSIFTIFITTLENLIDAMSEKVYDWAIDGLTEPLTRYTNCEKSIDYEVSPQSWISGCAKKLSNDEIELSIYNNAPVHRYFYPVDDTSVELIKTSVYGDIWGKGSVVISPNGEAQWKTTLKPGESITYGVTTDKKSFTAMLIDSIPIIPIKSITTMLEILFFSKNGRTPTLEDIRDILMEICLEVARRAGEANIGIPFLSFIVESGAALAFFSTDYQITFTYSLDSDHIKNMTITKGSTFARITFNTTDSASSELWVEAGGKMNQVLDFSGKNILTAHHDWEFGPLTPNTNYNYHLSVKGTGFRWDGTEEISRSFTTQQHPSGQQIGSGSDDILATPQITYSFDMYSQYTVTIAFQTPDSSLCEIQYAGGLFINSMFSTTGSVMNSVMAKADTSASTSHSIALTYVVPNTKFFYCIFDCRPADAQPWEEQTKQLIYFGSFETPWPY
jgi:hypothetical protein